MKSIVRKDTGEDWKEYVKGLMAEEGVENPSDEEVRRFDKKRKKKVSNKEWESPTDPDSRITKMKDSRTHLAYKAEHTVDLDSEFVLAAAVYPADQADAATLVDSVLQAQINLVQAGSAQEIEEAVADKGYHKAETLAECAHFHTRISFRVVRRRQRGSSAGRSQVVSTRSVVERVDADLDVPWRRNRLPPRVVNTDGFVFNAVSTGVTRS